MDKKQYHKDYYLAHKDELSEKRKEKWKNDPVYKAKLMEAAKKRQERIKREKEEKIASGEIPARKPYAARTRKYTIVVGGKEVDAYTIATLAKRIGGKSSFSVNSWVRRGVIPETPFKTSNSGHALYTDAMIDIVVKILDGKKRIANNMGLGEIIKNEWDNLYPENKQE